MFAFNSFKLDEWLYFLENRHQQEIQLGLSRIQTVAQRLNLLALEARIITVAGTNGKGSTVAALEAIYQAAGYQVGCYTSPHLLKFNERIQVNHQPISDEYLCAAFRFIEENRDEIALTYFEMTTLAAFWYFKQFKLDIIILEVGMGGRQDATNIIDADLAIITTIDLDHQEYLGASKEAIAYEKAGILRANKPFLYADTDIPVSLMKESSRLNASMCSLNKDYFFKSSNDYLQLVFPSGDTIKVPRPSINHKAAAAAITASRLLEHLLPVSAAHLCQAMKNVMIACRQQVIQGKITTVLDVAHNPQAVKLLVDFIEQLQPKKNVHAVFSALKDKDLCGLIKPMNACVDFWYPALLTGKRAATKSILLQAFKNAIHDEPPCFENPLMAYHAACRQAGPDDVIIVYGSFLTVNVVFSETHNFVAE
ncbi:bifunctional tetrahydrofolate synthase/dihydrofolate synthase [Legionella oakridgensis]|uniref:Dihydrofolate synthase/folylpolyglutamate synthase n=2 Tax=Legionella oakridgensis TaxID=29423 RepID=W0BEY6_9GAMM|nr:bifunctional tetrahydrofolate synthase/dihydrofolate synthase [Legionella oakridgensis]AHE67192.1 folylpolyglutamate synthase/dihydrofolate synthase [Legionella oakridgensis ATCC 33761 = DSM 21215]ETO93158.1 folylpolyglutamate synthase/dihydrofolate synthase [Legionella oakridgensis RV-2-2007]KTD38007.1 bifunctional protein FolC [Legionella oakridgensis]STY20271.1 folylpolyglutamate synthase [Legionella longbeachae]